MTFNIHITAINSTHVINTKNVDYHMSIVIKNKQKYLQFILIDKYEYNEDSVTLMNFLKATVLKTAFNGELLKLLNCMLEVDL
jgi:hypothetical protein